MDRKGRIPEKESSTQAREQAEEARKVAGRAIWRLNILEYVILLAAVLLSLLGGALVAWVLMTAASLPFRLTWAISSLLLFIIPGGSVYLRELRRGSPGKGSGSNTKP